jgi:hypothetical protein
MVYISIAHTLLLHCLYNHTTSIDGLHGDDADDADDADDDDSRFSPRNSQATEFW